MTTDAMGAGQADAVSVDDPSGLRKALSRYSAYGWKGRLGLIAPSTNTTLEPEFARLVPDGVAVHVSRVYQGGPQEPASYRRMADDMATAATMLATAEVDLLAFGCTSCTYFVSPDEVRATMADVGGCPVVLTADAVVAALRALGARRLALAGPRTRFVTERESAFLQDAGFEIVSSHCLGLGATEEERRAIGRVPPEVVYRLAREADRPEADAIFVSCTQLPTLGMIETIETALGKPVVTSNQALAWRCLRLMGVIDRQAGAGRLLAER